MDRGVFSAGRLASVCAVSAFVCPWPAFANDGGASGGFLVNHLDVMWIVFYLLLAMLIVLVVWEVIVQIQIRKFGDELLDSGTGVLAGTSDESAAETESSIDDGGSSFRALLNKAADEEEDAPAKSGYKASGVPGLDSQHIRRGDVAHSDVPLFDGTATLPVGSGAVIAQPLRQPVAPAPVAIPSPVAPPAGDEGNPFRRLAKIGAEEQGRTDEPVLSGSQTIVAPGVRPMSVPVARPVAATPPATPAPPARHSVPLSSPAPSGGDDPWKKLLSKSAPGESRPAPVGSGASDASGSRGAGRPGPGPNNGDDPWKALLGGINTPPTPKPPSSIPGAPVSPSRPSRPAVGIPLGSSDGGSGWPKTQPARPRGISLDIKRGGSRSVDSSPATDEK